MNTYLEAWELGLKAVAIYRDGSKRSAPLNTSKSPDGEASGDVRRDEIIRGFEQTIAELARDNEDLRKRADQPVRTKLPETRNSKTHKFEIAGHEGYITVGLFGDGRPGELFVYMSKEGSTIGGLMDTVATLTSMALQYGVPLEDLVRKFAFQRFEPSGYTGNPDIRTAFSITDYVFRWLGCEFIPGYRERTSPNPNQGELPMPEIEEMEKKAVNRPVAALSHEEPDQVSAQNNGGGVDAALGNAYMGVTCSNCGSDKVIRAGACGVCTQCGTSQGCS
jgi:ribonucleoside-diphosphate reductase alpha chain